MASVADIWNMALGLVGSDGDVQDPDSETSTPAKACRKHWETVRDECLRDFAWPRYKVVEDLALSEAEPNEGIYWQYAYAHPSNCLRVIRILNGATRLDTNANRVPYELQRKASDGSRLILTDLEDAQVEFIYHETNTEQYDPDVVSSMAHLLASRIAPRFGPEAVKLGDRALRTYAWRVAMAQQNALNEQQPDRDQSSDFERSRA